MRSVSFLLAALAAGCVSEHASDVAAADTTDVPTLSFFADWTVTQSAPLVAGTQARIHYDIARLPQCRAQYHGFPAWDILAYWNADGGTASNAPMTELNGTVRTGVDRIITVPPGHELNMWFYASDEFGCLQWDSAYGQNFRFAITGADVVLHFGSDWSNTRTGTLGPDGTILVDYDIARLPGCRQDYNGLQTWDVQVDYRFDGGAVQQASLTKVLDTGERVGAPALLHAPAGAHTVELWFENSDRTGCHTWDSDYGRNFSFALP